MAKDKRDIEAGLRNKGFQQQPGGDHNSLANEYPY